MQAIVAADLNFAIGFQGQMLYHLPEDLKFFARMTRGKVLIMGRGTLKSLPSGKPLKDRLNIVLSRNEHFIAPPGALRVRGMAELKAAIAPYPAHEVMVIGGQHIYALLIDCCTLPMSPVSWPPPRPTAFSPIWTGGPAGSCRRNPPCLKAAASATPAAYMSTTRSNLCAESGEAYSVCFGGFISPLASAEDTSARPAMTKKAPFSPMPSTIIPITIGPSVMPMP
jgi:hypothetical protein